MKKYTSHRCIPQAAAMQIDVLPSWLCTYIIPDIKKSLRRLEGPVSLLWFFVRRQPSFSATAPPHAQRYLLSPIPTLTCKRKEILLHLLPLSISLEVQNKNPFLIYNCIFLIAFTVRTHLTKQNNTHTSEGPFGTLRRRDFIQLDISPPFHFSQVMKLK